MFEPVHGSAPGIAGQGIANPVAAIWTASMMLDHLGQKEAAEAMLKAVEVVLETGTVLTRDLGGRASTGEFTDAVLEPLA